MDESQELESLTIQTLLFMKKNAPFKLKHNFLSLRKAFQFVGDNSAYQRTAVLLCCIPIFATTVEMTLLSISTTGSEEQYQFFIFSAAGTLLWPYFAEQYGRLKTLLASTALFLLGSIFVLDKFIFNSLPFIAGLGVSLCGLARGALVVAYLYIAEVSGENTRAWTPIWVGVAAAIAVPFTGLLGVASAVLMLPLAGVALWLMRTKLRQSPRFLVERKRNYQGAKQIMGYIANYNQRPEFAFRIEGEEVSHSFADNYTYLDFLMRDSLRSQVLPLALLWAVRQVCYSTSLLAITALGSEKRSFLVLCGVSQLAGMVLSAPFKLKFRRVTSLAAMLGTITVTGCLGFAFTVPSTCASSVCYQKYVSLLLVMATRFATSMLGSILITYSLQVLRPQTKAMALGICVALSSAGSLVVPIARSLSLVGVSLLGFTGLTAGFGLALTRQLEQTSGILQQDEQRPIPLLAGI